MDRIETIQLWPYRPSEQREALSAFNRLVLQDPDEGLKSITMMQDTALGSDLCIVLAWHQDVFHNGKSTLGIQLAARFSEFGRIYHTVWAHTGKAHQGKRTNIEIMEQTLVHHHP